MNPKLKSILLLGALSVFALNLFAQNKSITSGTVIETGSAYTAISNTAALYISGSETVYSGTRITASSTIGSNGRYGVYAADHATVSLYSGTFYTNGGQSHAIRGDNVTLRVEDSIITSGTVQFAGIYLRNADATIINSSIHGAGRGFDADGGNVTLSNVDIVTGSIGIAGKSNWTLNHVTVTCVDLDSAVGALHISGTLNADDVQVLSSGYGLASYVAADAQASINFTNSSITVIGAHPIISLGAYSDDIQFIFTGGTLAGNNGQDLLELRYGNSVNRVTLDDVDASQAGGIHAGLDFSGTATATVNGGSDIHGDIDNDGSTLTVNFNDSTLTGDVIGSGSSNTTITGSNGTTITGTVSGNDNSIIDLTVSGTGSTLLGDINQNNDAAVTVTLDDHASGTGAFNGGDLITGGDSTWTFDKDSHGNYGKNDGVWNIGDYEVIFDNMTNTGTLNLSINSDTGEGGSITVTGTADGDGKVHIDTTGNGKADPNQVLPGKVTGAGTEHWQWDPIDWGIDTIIKDGDHFIKQGTSPAGAVLNSSVAIQQAMWFAQQNSLLKRMGELRYGARASRPLADKDVRVPYNSLIENIWLRSYGQQLNIGSKVAGKAYEQLIYGVDLGTDHKFTISADSDLYLGIYAGYGRSDLDYRTPGADGEINSYYGGLYATWLHSSGFYLDATIKAASVNNDLKAPYGSTQLKASYSDINLGGSLELGKKFTFTDAWFIEPQFQVNYLHILAENYTAGPMSISAQDLDALQFRIGSLFGRSIKLTNGGALQPYIKISGVETISSGGTLRNGYQHIRANTDGARAELGGGLIWQLDANNQLHLDYEASFGDKYDKPWGLTAGYRHQF